MVSLSVLLPLYIYPSGTAWSALYTAISNYPSITFNVVINPDSGPGSSTAPDSNYINGIKTLNGYSNVKTLGYVHTSYASRAIADVESDIASYSNWASYSAADIHMDGIFFDEAPSDDTSTDVSYMTSAASFARSNLTTSSPFITFNPGVAVADAYYAEADLVLACEDTYSDFSSSSSSYISAVSGEASKSAFVINTFSGSSSDMSTVVNEIYSGGIGSIYVTTSSDYSAFGNDLTMFMSAVASPGSASSSSTSSSSTSSSSTSSSSTSSSSASSATSAMASSTTSATAASTSAAKTTSTSTTPTPTATQSSPQNKQASQNNQGHHRARWIPRSWGIKALADLVD